MKASIDSIESFGLVDGPGIRTVIFFNSCKLRCKFCHNPETWKRREDNYTVLELLDRIIRNKPYFHHNGGVTFSGGEPLLHMDFLLELCPLLKEQGIHIALDTAGVGTGNYEKLLPYIDLVIFDIKGLTEEEYYKMTGCNIEESLKFLDVCQKMNKKMWIRQVIIPGINDTEEYILRLKRFINSLHNIERIELLPYHTMGIEKYRKLGISYPLEGVPPMDKEVCSKLQDILTK